MGKRGSNVSRILHTISLSATLFCLSSILFSNASASVYSSCLLQSNATIKTPPITLSSGATGTSTIYTNSTSALVQVSAPNTQNWLTGWSYRQQQNITSASGADVGYECSFTISNATGTSSGNVCYANGHVRNSDFSDVRVTASDGTALLSIWNGTVNSGNNATIWFKDTDNLTSTGSIVYVYYGNAGAPYVGNGTNPFLFFDDLSPGTLGKYDIQQTGTSGSLSVDATGGNPAPSIKGSVSGGSASSSTWTIAGNSSSFLPNNYRVDMDVNLTGSAALVDLLTNCHAVNGPFYVFRFDTRAGSNDLIGAYPSGASTTTVLYTTSITSSTGTWLHMTAIKNGANLSLYKGGSVNSLGTLEATYADSTYNYSGGGIAVTTDGATSTDWFDNVVARSYLSPEPTQGAWGTEQDLSGQNWLTGWSYRQQHNITQSSGAGTNYQLNITICNGTGTSSGCICYANGHVKNTDFSDVRITDSTGKGLLSIWNQTAYSGGVGNLANATIWFQDTDNLTSAISTVYIYYGNAGASPVFNGANTFDYFDTGSPSGWTVVGSAGQDANTGNPTPSLYAVSVNGNYMYKSVGLAPNRLIIFNVMTNGLGNLFFSVNSAGAGQMYRMDTRGGTDYAGFATATSWTSWSAPSSGFNPSPNAWYKFAVAMTSSTSATFYYQQTTDATPNLPSTIEATHVITNNGGYIGLVGDALGASYDTWWDNIIVRHYASPEPTQGAWGTEQQAGVLNVVNQAANAWYVSLKVTSTSNIIRLSNAVISLHNATTSSDQIIISSGSVIQSSGAIFDLPGGAGSTVYVSMSNLLANATGSSYLYVYLKILIPSTTTYSLYVITFEVD